MLASVQVPRVPRAALRDQGVQRAAGLVAHRHQRERRVVAVRFENTVEFVADELVALGLLAENRRVHRPQRHLDLKQKSQFIPCLERRLRRAPGMEPHMVEPVRPADAEHPPPRRLVHRRITRQRVYAFIDRTTQEDGLPVERDLPVLRGQGAVGEGRRGRGHAALQPGLDLVQPWIELVPLKRRLVLDPFECWQQSIRKEPPSRVHLMGAVRVSEASASLPLGPTRIRILPSPSCPVILPIRPQILTLWLPTSG